MIFKGRSMEECEISKEKKRRQTNMKLNFRINDKLYVQRLQQINT